MAWAEWQAELSELAAATMTVREAADYLEITPRAMNRLLDRNRLTGLNFKDRVLITVASVEGYKRWKLGRSRCYMALYAEKNLYQGVNPHLMSLYQTPGWGGYRSFHTNYITELTFALNRLLPPGYRAKTEDTLSILRRQGDTDIEAQTRYPDVSIRETMPSQPGASSPSAGIAPDLRVPFPEMVLDSVPMAAIIYKMSSADRQMRGLPVTVIEVLSPGNKTGLGREQYHEKRYQLLQTGIALVEIDLLHESRSLIAQLPGYPSADNSMPYYLAVSNPRAATETDIYRFGIDQPMPAIPIPLLNSDVIAGSFDAVFQSVFVKGRYGDDVDYHQEPLRMNTYSQSDQQAIRSHMQKLAQAYPAGSTPE